MKKYLYVVLAGFPIKYLQRKRDLQGNPKDHPYEKDNWTTSTSVHSAYRGTTKNPPRKKFGGTEVTAVEVEKIHEFITMYRTLTD